MIPFGRLSSGEIFTREPARDRSPTPTLLPGALQCSRIDVQETRIIADFPANCPIQRLLGTDAFTMLKPRDS